jgi:tyrosinase
MKLRSTLSRSEKRNYLDAIQCIHSKPALTPSAVAPGAKSRYDDFVVTHVLQTYSVHATVSLQYRIRSAKCDNGTLGDMMS